MAARVGWYRLPRSGRLFHGTVPPGAVEEPAWAAEQIGSTPSVETGEQLVDASESGGPVGSDVLVADNPADSLEVGTGPGAGSVEHDARDDLDAVTEPDPVAHEPEG